MPPAPKALLQLLQGWERLESSGRTENPGREGGAVSGSGIWEVLGFVVTQEDNSGSAEQKSQAGAAQGQRFFVPCRAPVATPSFGDLQCYKCTL